MQTITTSVSHWLSYIHHSEHKRARTHKSSCPPSYAHSLCLSPLGLHSLCLSPSSSNALRPITIASSQVYKQPSRTNCYVERTRQVHCGCCSLERIFLRDERDACHCVRKSCESCPAPAKRLTCTSLNEHSVGSPARKSIIIGTIVDMTEKTARNACEISRVSTTMPATTNPRPLPLLRDERTRFMPLCEEIAKVAQRPQRHLLVLPQSSLQRGESIVQCQV